MAYTVVENIRGFFMSRPPLVVFMICLAAFAVSLITFAYIVKAKELPNPDVTEDWNTFLEKFSRLEFCISHNASAHNASGVKSKVGDMSASGLYKSLKETVYKDSISHDSQEQPSVNPLVKRSVPQTYDVASQPEGLHSVEPVAVSRNTQASTASTVAPLSTQNSRQNITVSMLFKISPAVVSRSAQLSSTHHIGSVSSNMLHLDGVAKEDKISVTISFPVNLSSEACDESLGKDLAECIVHVCVTFQGPASVLPQTMRPDPGKCEAPIEGAVNEMNVRAPLVGSASHWCEPAGSSMVAQYLHDDSLTVLLSLHDKAMINLHLMRTSYFLFVMVITLFCYAMIKGRPIKHKPGHVTYEKVITQA